MAKAAATLKQQGDFQRPMVIVGAGAFIREDGDAVQAAARKAAEDLGCIRDDWNGFNVLHMAASRVGAMPARCRTSQT